MEEKIAAGLIQFVALGDRHSKTDVGSTGRVWYAGAPEPTDYVETDPGYVLVVDVDAGSKDVDARRVGTWRFVRHDCQLSGDGDLDALEEWLSSQPNKERAIVKLGLVGAVSLAQKARLEEVLEHNRDLFAALDDWESRSELVVIPDELDIDRLGLSGFAREAVEELSAKAEAGEESVVVARDALALLYRLSGSGE